MSDLIVRNVLTEKTVVITALVRPGEERDNRKTVLTVGIPDERVVLRAGRFADLTSMIDSAWSEYMQVATNTPQADEATGELASIPVEQTGGFIYSDDDF